MKKKNKRSDDVKTVDKIDLTNTDTELDADETEHSDDDGPNLADLYLANDKEGFQKKIQEIATRRFAFLMSGDKDEVE